MVTDTKSLRIASVIPSLTAGGIGAVCRYAAEGMASITDWDVTLLSLHDPVTEYLDENNGLRTVCLGLDDNCARQFLDWLVTNPQDLIITSDVSHIEPAFPFLPQKTRHIVQIHDSSRRYREVAVRNQRWIDGVTCVGQHIEKPLRTGLSAIGYEGLLRAVHNGANFPPVKPRKSHDGPIRLLYMGRVEAFKGIYDFVPILYQLKKHGVPVSLNIVGGDSDSLRRQFHRNDLDSMVVWSGRVPHSQCYKIAEGADVFLMTSRQEAFGMVTIEAMSMGCVPIAYDIPSGSKEIIENGKSGFLVPLGDYEVYAKTIERLHNDRQFLAQLSANAIDRARTHFTADIMAANMVQFVTDVLQHADSFPSQRMVGEPPKASSEQMPGQGLYHRLPQGLRLWVRDQVFSRPKLSYWLLNR